MGGKRGRERGEKYGVDTRRCNLDLPTDVVEFLDVLTRGRTESLVATVRASGWYRELAAKRGWGFAAPKVAEGWLEAAGSGEVPAESGGAAREGGSDRGDVADGEVAAREEGRCPGCGELSKGGGTCVGCAIDGPPEPAAENGGVGDLAEI